MQDRSRIVLAILPHFFIVTIPDRRCQLRFAVPLLLYKLFSKITVRRWDIRPLLHAYVPYPYDSVFCQNFNFNFCKHTTLNHVFGKHNCCASFCYFERITKNELTWKQNSVVGYVKTLNSTYAQTIQTVLCSNQTKRCTIIEI